LGELSAQCADLVARREMLDAVPWPGVACLVGEERVGVDPERVDREAGRLDRLQVGLLLGQRR
jgi:hypothetical protein